MTFYPGPGNTVILYRTANDARMIAQPDLAQALKQCHQFRTLDAHAATVMRVIAALRESPEDVLATLQAVCDSGLLESNQQAWSRLTQNRPRTTKPPCRLFILTCDRPDALSRLLASLCSNGLPDEVEGAWIIDDSRDEGNSQRNAHIVETAKDQLAAPVYHFDLAQRAALMRHLGELIPEHHDAIRFLLERSEWGNAPTYGIARNLALLLSVGRRALVLDDDILCEALSPPLSATSLRFGTANERQAVFFNHRDELAQHAMALKDSPVTLMLGYVGQTLGEALSASLSGPEALTGWDGQLLSHLESTSPVLIAQCGSWGDPGTGSGNWTFNLDASSIKRLLEQKHGLAHTLSARSSWVGYRGPVLSQYGTLSQMTGLDNNHLLPPYLPAGRGEDILFGLLVQRLHPTSTVFNAGWAIQHQPIEDRAERGALMPISAEVSMNSLGDWLGREPQDQWGLSPERRLAGIVEQIDRLSEMAPTALNALIREEIVSKAGSLLRRSFEHLDSVNTLESAPGYGEWRTFLEKSRDQLVRQIQTPDPEPFTRVANDVGGADKLRSKGLAFGNALRAWPSIRDAAAQLMES